MKSIDEIKDSKKILIGNITDDGFRGEIHLYNWIGTIVCSWGGGWEHVSVAPYKNRIIPSWEDMCTIKGLIFNDEEWVVQFHPAKSEYVSNKNNCLHLWKPLDQDLPIPPSELTGLKKGQSIYEAKQNLKSIGLI